MHNFKSLRVLISVGSSNKTRLTCTNLEHGKRKITRFVKQDFQAYDDLEPFCSENTPVESFQLRNYLEVSTFLETAQSACQPCTNRMCDRKRRTFIQNGVICLSSTSIRLPSILQRLLAIDEINICC